MHIAVHNRRTVRPMASLWERTRADGTNYVSVRYRHNGKQTTTSFDDPAQAIAFQANVDRFGSAKALEIQAANEPAEALTVEQWVGQHIDTRTGITKGVVARYRRILELDITPTIGGIPLATLKSEDVAAWVLAMERQMVSPKTIRNKHALLSAALKSAAAKGHITINPCADIRLPRWDRPEMVFLEADEYRAVRAKVSDFWLPHLEFLVSSGARWSEMTALTPADVDRDKGTVRISKAWKVIPGGYELGTTKTKRSNRTIDVPKRVLDMPDYSGEWLYANHRGNPPRTNTFITHVWGPAVRNSGIGKAPRIHDLRHTCASWMINAGVPLGVVSRHLGHESISTTMDIYGHIDRSSSKAAADAIAAVLGEEQGYV
ncbi:site-specific integrase [Mycobacteroides chelonae]|uniref:Site-specific integrase n=1 Tax=Mycobacteroides chelonae TaxID=1774 RepID=A0AB73LTA3_MYCCH|nr:site-specific integrase [Mycobacteroides chelonae]OHT54964.1 site-specific integrase [Mycobacteroides chelonae]OHU67091.1 site-specific integrase [Mycobacteroides chelonae]